MSEYLDHLERRVADLNRQLERETREHERFRREATESMHRMAREVARVEDEAFRRDPVELSSDARRDFPDRARTTTFAMCPTVEYDRRRFEVWGHAEALRQMGLELQGQAERVVARALLASGLAKVAPHVELTDGGLRIGVQITLHAVSAKEGPVEVVDLDDIAPNLDRVGRDLLDRARRVLPELHRDS